MADRQLRLDPDRLFPADPSIRGIARALSAQVANLPIVSSHGHTDPVWSAANYHLFRGTPSRLWLDHVFADVFGIEITRDTASADHYFDMIGDKLATEGFRPRALLDRSKPH